MRAISIGKLHENLVNEDAAIARDRLIAVSNGAGGGGVFADLWSRYLVERLPDEPIVDYRPFDEWIDGIWESFVSIQANTRCVSCSFAVPLPPQYCTQLQLLHL